MQASRSSAWEMQVEPSSAQPPLSEQLLATQASKSFALDMQVAPSSTQFPATAKLELLLLLVEDSALDELELEVLLDSSLELLSKLLLELVELLSLLLDCSLLVTSLVLELLDSLLEVLLLLELLLPPPHSLSFPPSVIIHPHVSISVSFRAVSPVQ